MKFIHIADLHIGKRLCGYSLEDDQRYILDEIVSIANEKKVDAVLIAGDVYDRSVPSDSAFLILDEFLSKLHEVVDHIFIISGNHDSAEKLSFLSSVSRKQGIFFSRPYSGRIEKVSFDECDIYLLPFVRVADARRYFPDSEIGNITDALRIIIDNETIDSGRVNVLLSHQFVKGSVHAGSEELIIGGESEVDSSVFSAFDYVALGHIHSAQRAGSERIRYSGSPLKYSDNERGGKVVLYGEIDKESGLKLAEVPLRPLREVVNVRGFFDNVVKGPYTEDYVYVTLLDEEDVENSSAHLSNVYPNLLSVKYDNKRTRSLSEGITYLESEEEKSPIEYFHSLYKEIIGSEMDDGECAIVNREIERIWGSV